MDMANMVTATVMAMVTAMVPKTMRKRPAIPIPAPLLPKPPSLEKAAKNTIDLLISEIHFIKSQYYNQSGFLFLDKLVCVGRPFIKYIKLRNRGCYQ